jgi:hypothetical protein
MQYTAVGSNPFGVLTSVVAPAILTNACSVLALGTSNRLARVVDRTRVVAAELAGFEPGTSNYEDSLAQLDRLEVRAQLLLRALRLLCGDRPICRRGFGVCGGFDCDLLRAADCLSIRCRARAPHRLFGRAGAGFRMRTYGTRDAICGTKSCRRGENPQQGPLSTEFLTLPVPAARWTVPAEHHWPNFLFEFQARDNRDSAPALPWNSVATGNAQ